MGYSYTSRKIVGLCSLSRILLADGVRSNDIDVDSNTMIRHACASQVPLPGASSILIPNIRIEEEVMLGYEPTSF